MSINFWRARSNYSNLWTTSHFQTSLQLKDMASLIFGILSLLFALVPLWGPLLATPSIVIGITISISVLKTTKDDRVNRPARAGLILSIGAIAVMIINTVGRW